MLSGVYAVTALQCGSVPGPPDWTAAIAGGRTLKIEWTGAGQVATQTFSDGACAVSFTYGTAYPDAGIIQTHGFGVSTCTPNASACAGLLAAVPAAGTSCGADADPGVNLWSYTAIPVAAGGTLQLVHLQTGGVTACHSAGLTDPFSYSLTRQ
jgi:hypothetical protein